MSVRDYLNLERRSDLRDWVFQNGQAIAVIGVSSLADIPLETWYFDETSMAFDDGTDNATAFKPNDITITDPGRYLKTMVLSDWDKMINKPTIPAAQINCDWNSNSGVSQLLNKPSLFSGNYNDLINKPIIPSSQVQTDWNSVSGLGVLLNKPNFATIATSGNYNDLTNKPSIPTYIAGVGINIAGSTITNSAPDQIISLTGGNRISISGTYPNFTISYIEPTINIISSKTLNSNFTVSTSKQATVSYSLTCSVTNPLLAGSSTANVYLEYSTNAGSTWNLPSQNGNASTVGVAVAIAITNSQTVTLTGVIPANALVRLRTVTTGTASVTYITGTEIY